MKNAPLPVARLAAALRSHFAAVALFAALALSLAVAPAPAVASEDRRTPSAIAAEEANPNPPVSQDASEPSVEPAPEEEAGPAAADEPAAQTVTIYHFEMVHYDDPTFEDMGVPELTGLRLIGTSTVEGLKPGDTVNAWEHVGGHPGFMFFDGWPRELTVSEDPSENAIQLNYFRQSSDVTVNYYEASLAPAGGALPLRGDTTVETIGGQPVGFTKLGSEVRPRELYAAVLTGDDLAEAAFARPAAVPDEGSGEDLPNIEDDLAYVGSYPESVFVSMDSAKNEINLVYTRPVSGPDHVEMKPDAAAGAPDQDAGSGDDGEAGETPGNVGDAPAGDVGSDAAPAPDSTPGDGGAAADDAPAAPIQTPTQVPTSNAPAADATHRAELEAAAENGVLALPQTGDEQGPIIVIALLASALAAAGIATALRRLRRQ